MAVDAVRLAELEKRADDMAASQVRRGWLPLPVSRKRKKKLAAVYFLMLLADELDM